MIEYVWVLREGLHLTLDLVCVEAAVAVDSLNWLKTAVPDVLLTATSTLQALGEESTNRYRAAPKLVYHW